MKGAAPGRGRPAAGWSAAPRRRRCGRGGPRAPPARLLANAQCQHILLPGYCMFERGRALAGAGLGEVAHRRVHPALRRQDPRVPGRQQRGGAQRLKRALSASGAQGGRMAGRGGGRVAGGRDGTGRAAPHSAKRSAVAGSEPSCRLAFWNTQTFSTWRRRQGGARVTNPADVGPSLAGWGTRPGKAPPQGRTHQLLQARRRGGDARRPDLRST
jgi:hypothetical protein